MKFYIKSIALLTLFSVKLFSIYAQDDWDDMTVEQRVLERVFWYENIGSSDTSCTFDEAMEGAKCQYIAYGIVLKEGYYKGGVRDGEWRYYDSQGDLFAVKYFDKGVPTGTWEYYHEGQVFAREKRTDTSWQVLMTMGMNDTVYLVTYTRDSLKAQLFENDKIIEVSSNDKYWQVLRVNGELFTGYYIHDDVPTTTWMGMAEVRDGIRHGENITQAYKKSSYINGVEYGAVVASQMRYSSFNKFGSYYNDKKYGRWKYEPFSGEVGMEIDYNYDTVRNYRLYDYDNKVNMKKPKLADSLMGLLRREGEKVYIKEKSLLQK